MENKICKNCKHFRQHYIKRARGNYHPIRLRALCKTPAEKKICR